MLLQEMCRHESSQIRKLAILCLYGPMLYQLNLKTGEIKWKAPINTLIESESIITHDKFLRCLSSKDRLQRLENLEKCHSTKKEQIFTYNFIFGVLDIKLFEKCIFTSEKNENGETYEFICGFIQLTPECRALVSLEEQEPLTPENRKEKIEELQKKEDLPSKKSTKGLTWEVFESAVNVRMAKDFEIIVKRSEVLQKEEEFDDSTVRFDSLVMLGLSNFSKIFTNYGAKGVTTAEKTIRDELSSMLNKDDISTTLDNGFELIFLANSDRWVLFDFIEELKKKLNSLKVFKGQVQPLGVGAAFIYPHYGIFADQMTDLLKETLSNIEIINESYVGFYMQSVNTGSVYPVRPGSEAPAEKKLKRKNKKDS